MSKFRSVEDYREQLNASGKAYFDAFERILQDINPNIRKILFVSQPYYYDPKYENVKPHYRKSVMMAYFKDHVNIFALANEQHKKALSMYKMTDKFTLQIAYDVPIETLLLKALFDDSLN